MMSFDNIFVVVVIDIVNKCYDIAFTGDEKAPYGNLMHHMDAHMVLPYGAAIWCCHMVQAPIWCTHMVQSSYSLKVTLMV